MDVRLSDSEWKFVESHLSHKPPKKSWNGRPRASDRLIFEAFLWLLATGSRWRDIPEERYPAKSSCHRRFQEWAQDGSFRALHKALVHKLKSDGVINFEEAFVDGSDVRVKKGVKKSVTSVEEGALALWLSLSHMVFRLELMSLLPTGMRQAYLSQPWSIPSDIRKNLKTYWGIKPTALNH